MHPIQQFKTKWKPPTVNFERRKCAECANSLNGAKGWGEVETQDTVSVPEFRAELRERADCEELAEEGGSQEPWLKLSPGQICGLSLPRHPRLQTVTPIPPTHRHPLTSDDLVNNYPDRALGTPPHWILQEIALLSPVSKSPVNVVYCS